MKLPNMKEAKSRNKEKVEYIYEEPIKNEQFLGEKYFIRTWIHTK